MKPSRVIGDALKFALAASVLMACGSSESNSSGDATSTTGSSSTASATSTANTTGNATTAGGSISTGTGGSTSTSNSATTSAATTSAATTSATSGSVGPNPYDGVMRMPDADPTPVADCAGQPDMTLCNVVTEPDRSYDICVKGQCVSPGCGDSSCNVPAPHFVIPPTSDHHYFERVSGDEPVVIDLVTGLYWQGCVAGRAGDACEGDDPDQLTWADAFAYCDALSWGGFDDWYLPDAYEAVSIIDFSPDIPMSFNLALDTRLFPNPWSQTWTSHLIREGKIYEVQMYGPSSWALSTAISGGPTSEQSVRCVRRGFSRDAGYTDTRFYPSVPAAADEPVIDDVATGLMWQGCVAGRSGLPCEGSVELIAISDLEHEPANTLPWARQWAEIDTFDAVAQSTLLKLLIGSGFLQEAERRNQHTLRQSRQVAAPEAATLEKRWRALRSEAPVVSAPPGACRLGASGGPDGSQRGKHAVRGATGARRTGASLATRVRPKRDADVGAAAG